jgi:hypothetical protein
VLRERIADPSGRAPPGIIYAIKGREGLGTQWTPGPEIASQDRGQEERQTQFEAP